MVGSFRQSERSELPWRRSGSITATDFSGWLGMSPSEAPADGWLS